MYVLLNHETQTSTDLLAVHDDEAEELACRRIGPDATSFSEWFRCENVPGARSARRMFIWKTDERFLEGYPADATLLAVQ